MRDNFFQYVLPLLLALLVLSYLYGQPMYVRYRRNKIRARPFPKQWRQIIKRRVPYFFSLPTDLQLQLKGHIQVFIAEKQFVGGAGLIIDDDIRVTIASQACLLLLNRKTNYYPKLQTIVVYPTAFLKNQQITDITGISSQQKQMLLGESWQFGKVILSWQHSIEGAQRPHDGSNVVIHEFAHQLDQESGSANGAPPLSTNNSYDHWAKVFSKEFKQLQQQAQHHEKSILNNYGATNEAEFFAVASEAFFEQPSQLYQQHRPLYRQLKKYYHVDPLNWH